MAATLALLVDGDADTRSVYRAALEIEGWNVDEAVDGPEALAKTIAQRPEVLVTETRLRGMSGVDLCVQIRADPEVFETCIIVVTATGTSGAIVEAQSAGADRVLIKPCPPDRLLTNIAELRDESRAVVQRAKQSVRELYDDIARTRKRIEESNVMIRGVSERFERRITTLPPTPPRPCCAPSVIN